MNAVGQPPMPEYTPAWSKSATKMGSVCSVGMPWKIGYISRREEVDADLDQVGVLAPTISLAQRWASSCVRRCEQTLSSIGRPGVPAS